MPTSNVINVKNPDGTYTGYAPGYEPGGAKNPTVPSTTLKQDQAKAANQGQPGYDVLGNQITPTVVTDATVREDYIPDMNKRLNALSENRPTYQGMNGQTYYSDNPGELAQAPVDARPNAQGDWELDGNVYGVAPTFIEDDPQSNALFSSMIRNLDAQTRQIVEGIQQQFQVRKAQQADINKRAEAGTEQALLMGGSSRYAPISSGGIVQAQQTYGLQQIADLDAQEQSLIAQAQAAQQAGEYQLFGKALEAAEAKRKEKQAAAVALSQSIAAENEKMRAQQITSARDLAIGELISGGVTSVNDIMRSLTDAGYPATAQEISDAMKLFTISGTNPGDIKTDFDTFNYFKSNNMLPAKIAALEPNEQYFAWLNMNKLANSGKLSAAGQYYGGEGGGGIAPGKGAASAVDEKIIRTRLFAKLSTILNKGQLSDDDRKVIDGAIATFRNAGLSEQEIMSRLAGFPADVNTPYNQSFIDLITANTGTLEIQQMKMAKVGQLLASGNALSAMKEVENTALERVKKFDPDAYISNSNATTLIKNVERIRTLLADNVGTGFQISSNIPPGKDTGVVGPITGTFQNLLGRIKGERATEIKAELTNLYQAFRKENLGSAVTPSEAAFLDPLFASITDKKGNFITKLDAFERQLLERYNSARSTASLPTLTPQQVIDPSARLPLYATGTTADFWGTDTGGEYEITDGSGLYEIPE